MVAAARERSTVVAAQTVGPFPRGLSADMLTHSPPLPFVIEYIAISDLDEITSHLVMIL